MGRILLKGAYHILRVVEQVSIKLGSGRFEVPTNFNCTECQQREPQCSACPETWVQDVMQLEYTDAMERSLTIFMGWVLVVMGVSGAWFNARVGAWESGPVVTGIVEVLFALKPDFLTLPHILKLALTILIATIFVVSTIIFTMFYFGTFMVVAMYPKSKRIWRHFTPSAMLAAVVLALCYMVVIALRVNVLDLAFVVGPVLTGIYAWVCVLCMRESEDGSMAVDKEKGVGDKLV